jgi:multiple RNA-binding domain-containing protein 1
VLDPTSSDAAIKQAHAETHLIQETKSYFAQHGVDLEAFKRSSKGDIAILVKNIPHGTSSDELRRLFEEHGKITKFLMPPAGMTAIIEFSNAAEAKAAFRSLAYRKMKDSILYLEKAPKDLFKEGVAVPTAPATQAVDGVSTKLAATDLLQDAPEPESTNTATLYVRNLNFSTTTQGLTETFSPLEGFRSARVKTKVDPKRGVLSMGLYVLQTPDHMPAANYLVVASSNLTVLTLPRQLCVPWMATRLTAINCKSAPRIKAQMQQKSGAKKMLRRRPAGRRSSSRTCRLKLT